MPAVAALIVMPFDFTNPLIAFTVGSVSVPVGRFINCEPSTAGNFPVPSN